MAQQLPVIVVVQGGAMAVEAYVPLQYALSELGYIVIHPVHPTLYTPDHAEKGSRSIEDDATNVRSVISRFVEVAGQEVVVVCHSYGGLVSNEAITESLTVNWRRAKGLPGGVVHLYMIASAVIPKGTAIGTEAMTSQAGYMVSEDGKTFIVKNNKETFYNDSTREEGDFWESMHRWMSTKILTYPLTNEAWHHLDTTYMITGNDNLWPPDIQRQTAAMMNAKVDEIDAGHSPWLKDAKEVARRIDAAARQSMQHAQ